ncbi:MAG: hypothetical protein EOO45_00220 [Flavobacterium sp.]|nr:MAG: hypothetical protein EOO45_00220 [Flavobacterium sp.]
MKSFLPNLLMIAVFICSCVKDKKNSLSQLPPPKWIAHALGAYNGANYLNCKECFDSNYAKGFRYFEMDFLMSSDGSMVGMHDGQEKEFGLPKDFTLEMFKKASLQGTTPVDDELLSNLMNEKKDWFLITDIKDENFRGLKRLCDVLLKKDIDCKTRVIPQFYSKEDLEILKTIAFERSIFTLYRFGDKPQEVKELIDANPTLWGITIPLVWWKPEYFEAIKAGKRYGFVHTINDRPAAESLFASGADGIYTDNLFY